MGPLHISVASCVLLPFINVLVGTTATNTGETTSLAATLLQLFKQAQAYLLLIPFTQVDVDPV